MGTSELTTNQQEKKGRWSECDGVGYARELTENTMAGGKVTLFIVVVIFHFYLQVV